MSDGRPSGLRVVDFGPIRTSFRPGSEATISLAVDGAGGPVDARLELFDEGRVVGSIERRLRLPAGRSARLFRLGVPSTRLRGYGLRVQLESRAGSAEAHSAFEALDGWWESPRHAALTEFEPGSAIASTLARLRRWHVNVVQHYDWMYRHYRYSPPAGEVVFTDTLGRRVSHDVVRDLVRQGRRQGIASLAYGSVYGAEREYVERYPEQLLRDTDGAPLSLGDTFFITDLRPWSRWRARLIGEYVRACRNLGFDGVHMDQYGEPHAGVASDGSPVELDAVFAGLVDEAAQRLGSLSPPRRVLFNCVRGWPLEKVAGAASAATYLELWPPDTTYASLLAQIERARRLAPDKQVVIAAYPSVVATGSDDGGPSPGALEAVLLLTSVVLAAGAHHHALAERDRVLVGGYYPDAVPLPAAAAERLRLAWQFSARYVHLLTDTRSQPFGVDGLVIECDGRRLPVSPEPRGGTVWVRAQRTAQGKTIVQLVDLLAQMSDEWDVPRQPAVRRDNWRLSWPGSCRRWLCASPWSGGGMAAPLADADEMPIPAFERWTMLIGEDR